MHARVLQRLVHGEVRVVQLHVLADERDLDLAVERVDPLDERAPLFIGATRRLEAELVEDERVEPLLLEHRRHEVDVADVRARNDRLHVDVGEERDLVADVRRQLSLERATTMSGGYRCGATR